MSECVTNFEHFYSTVLLVLHRPVSTCVFLNNASVSKQNAQLQNSKAHHNNSNPAIISWSRTSRHRLLTATNETYCAVTTSRPGIFHQSEISFNKNGPIGKLSAGKSTSPLHSPCMCADRQRKTGAKRCETARARVRVGPKTRQAH